MESHRGRLGNDDRWPLASLMAELTIRSLAKSELAEHRRLYAAYPDAYAASVVQCFPAYFDIARFFDPDGEYVNRQRLVLGAFINGELIGTVSVERTEPCRETELDEDQWNAFFEKFSTRDLDVFNTWNESLRRTIIGAPHGSLTLHSLSVTPAFRRMGIAPALIRAAISGLNDQERIHLYTETVRLRWLIRLFESLSFAVVQKTFSLSERLEYGCWGSVLMRFRDPPDIVAFRKTGL